MPDAPIAALARAMQRTTMPATNPDGSQVLEEEKVFLGDSITVQATPARVRKQAPGREAVHYRYGLLIVEVCPHEMGTWQPGKLLYGGTPIPRARSSSTQFHWCYAFVTMLRG